MLVTRLTVFVTNAQVKKTLTKHHNIVFVGVTSRQFSSKNVCQQNRLHNRRGRQLILIFYSTFQKNVELHLVRNFNVDNKHE